MNTLKTSICILLLKGLIAIQACTSDMAKTFVGLMSRHGGLSIFRQLTIKIASKILKSFVNPVLSLSK